MASIEVVAPLKKPLLARKIGIIQIKGLVNFLDHRREV
jgi:hypothetical protein